MKGRTGHLLGNRAWAWDVRTNLWDNRLGWMAWLGAKAGLAACVNPGWPIGATEPTTVPAKVWPKVTAPNTCCPLPMLPEEAAVLLLTGGVAWALWVAVPMAVKYKAMGMGLHVRFHPILKSLRSTCFVFIYSLCSISHSQEQLVQKTAKHKIKGCDCSMMNSNTYETCFWNTW